MPVKAFVISQTETSYVIVDENTKQYTTLEKPYKLGEIVVLPNGTEVQLSELDLTSTKLFYALKEYEYNLNRKKEQYKKVKMTKTPPDYKCGFMPLQGVEI